MVSVSNLTSLSHSSKSDFSTVSEFGLFKSSHTRRRRPLPSQNREKRPRPSLQRKRSVTPTCMPIMLDMTAFFYPVPGTSPAFLIVMSIGGGRPLSEAVTSLIAANHLLHTVLFDIILHRFIFPHSFLPHRNLHLPFKCCQFQTTKGTLRCVAASPLRNTL
jgi:hypothetical protein